MSRDSNVPLVVRVLIHNTTLHDHSNLRAVVWRSSKHEAEGGRTAWFSWLCAGQTTIDPDAPPLHLLTPALHSLTPSLGPVAEVGAGGGVPTAQGHGRAAPGSRSRPAQGHSVQLGGRGQSGHVQVTGHRAQ